MKRKSSWKTENSSTWKTSLWRWNVANPTPPCPQWFRVLPESSARSWQPLLIQPVACSGTRVRKLISPLPLSTYKWTLLSFPVYASGCQAPKEDKTPLGNTHGCFQNHALLSVGLWAAWTGTVLVDARGFLMCGFPLKWVVLCFSYGWDMDTSYAPCTYILM